MVAHSAWRGAGATEDLNEAMLSRLVILDLAEGLVEEFALNRQFRRPPGFFSAARADTFPKPLAGRRPPTFRGKFIL